MSYQQVILSGVITSEIKFTHSNEARFTLTTTPTTWDEDKKAFTPEREYKEFNFISAPPRLLGVMADIKPGDYVEIEGRLKTTATDQLSGKKRYSTQVIALKIIKP